MNTASKGDSAGGEISVLADEYATRKDVALVSKAVRLKWPIRQDARKAIADRLLEIVEKREVSVITKAGEVEAVDGPADVNAIAAARVLVAMNGQNIAQDKPAVAPPTVNVQVNVDADARRDKIREIAGRIRDARIADEPASG